MTVNVGLHPYCGELSYYNNADKITFNTKINEVRYKGIEKINPLFEEIKSIINGTLGCLCICLYRQDGYKIRKKFIEEGLIAGFKKVEIINFETSCYIIAMSQIPYKPKNGVVIWMHRFVNFYALEIRDGKARIINGWNVHSMEDMEKILNDPKVKAQKPAIVFYDCNLYEEVFKKIAECQLFEFRYQPFGFSKGALLKARITDGNSELAYLNADNFLSRNIDLTLIGEEIVSFKYGQHLPLNFSKILNLEEDGSYIEIEGHSRKIIELPEEKNVKIDFQVDSNEIYTITITPV